MLKTMPVNCFNKKHSSILCSTHYYPTLTANKSDSFIFSFPTIILWMLYFFSSLKRNGELLQEKSIFLHKEFHKAITDLSRIKEKIC